MTLSLTFLLCAIQLAGVTGNGLRARAYFDENNVKVGDPLSLTVDFIGEADFGALHPPALAKDVDGRDWKVYDESAKTDTFRDARRLTYRVRPQREGVLWFPALAFSYASTDGRPQTVTMNAIPVHVKPGAQVVVEEMGRDDKTLPQPDALIVDLPAGRLRNDDERFAWRKACAKPTADAFRAFDFPEARFNEARQAILEGNWARAMKIYQGLEWSVGQTPALERGIVAALAVRYDNPQMELPVWRQVGRPLLRYSWVGRVSWVLGGFLGLAALFWLLGRGIRAVACVAFVLLALPLPAQDIFQQMEERMRQMRQQMGQMSSFSFGGGFGQGQLRSEQIEVRLTVTTDRPHPQVGEPFAFILALEYPKTASVQISRIARPDAVGLTVTGQASELPRVASRNPSNMLARLSVPVRCDVPFRGPVSFSVEGMVSGRQTRNGGRFSFSFSNSFRSESKPLALEVRPLATDGQPPEFAGIVSEGLAAFEYPNLLTVETNDVVTIAYKLRPHGYVPADFLPEGAAFEWERRQDETGRLVEIEYRRYFVADGASVTPVVRIAYFDPRSRSYKSVDVGGTPLKYVPARQD